MQHVMFLVIVFDLAIVYCKVTYIREMLFPIFSRFDGGTQIHSPRTIIAKLNYVYCQCKTWYTNKVYNSEFKTP